jgi:hypothetical protein
MMPSDFGPLPFLDAKAADPVGVRPNVVLFYHQPAFLLLGENLTDRIEHALLTAPAAVRARYLVERLPVEQEVAADLAWPVVRGLLDVLEAEMAEVLRKRSVFFWMHIYRRIGVKLASRHEDKIDPRTVGLVRQIVELAITKHGRTTDADEIVLSSRVKPDLILGGFMRAGFKALFKTRFTKTYRLFVESLRTRPQWVIKDFTKDDFIGIYRMESLAYQYWRATALLRALGKGARITVTRNGDWNYTVDDDLSWLIESIDERTEEGRLDGSLLGTWFDEGPRNAKDAAICPVYNVDRVSSAEMFRQLGLPISGDHVSNFLPASFDARRYLEAHDFLSDTFQAQRGYSLEVFVATVWAIAESFA